jgi:hypothetical protein
MELILKFSTEKPTHCRICKGELPVEYDKTCDACLTRERHRDMARRQKRKFEEIKNIVPGDLPAKAAKKELHITKVNIKREYHEAWVAFSSPGPPILRPPFQPEY